MFREDGLTEVQRHADEDDQAEPGVEVGDKVDDRNDDVRNGWEDAEHNVAAGGGRIKEGVLLNSFVGKQLTFLWEILQLFIALPLNLR